MASVTATASFNPDKINIFNKPCNVNGRKLSCFNANLCFRSSFRPASPVGPVGKSGSVQNLSRIRGTLFTPSRSLVLLGNATLCTFGQSRASCSFPLWPYLVKRHKSGHQTSHLTRGKRANWQISQNVNPWPSAIQGPSKSFCKVSIIVPHFLLDVSYTLTLDADLQASRVTSRGLFTKNNERLLTENAQVSSTPLCRYYQVYVQVMDESQCVCFSLRRRTALVVLIRPCPVSLDRRHPTSSTPSV